MHAYWRTFYYSYHVGFGTDVRIFTWVGFNLADDLQLLMGDQIKDQDTLAVGSTRLWNWRDKYRTIVPGHFLGWCFDGSGVECHLTCQSNVSHKCSNG